MGTRDFFAEKVLDKLERKCRFELFDCEFSTSSSDALVEHETQCEQKPPVPVKRKRAAAAIAAQENNEDNEEEDEDEEDDDEEDEGGEDEEDVLEDIFVSNFAFVVVLLRAYMLEFGDVTKHNNMYLEYFLLFLLLVWVYYVWQENRFAMLLDETSPFIAAYFVLVVLCLVSLKALYSDERRQLVCPWLCFDSFLSPFVRGTSMEPVLLHGPVLLRHLLATVILHRPAIRNDRPTLSRLPGQLDLGSLLARC